MFEEANLGLGISFLGFGWLLAKSYRALMLFLMARVAIHPDSSFSQSDELKLLFV